MKPMAIDLFCGLGGWAEGFLSEGYDVVGFDIERHKYPRRDINLAESSKSMSGKDKHGNTLMNRALEQVYGFHKAKLTGEWDEYPGQLVIQDVLTLHGSQFRDAAVIVASPPCQAYSYMAMPWSRAKAMAADIRADVNGQKMRDLTALFDACFRIQREACEAAGRYIPLVVENVKGAQPWVGRAAWHYGSFYLWGDVPALMPWTGQRRMKCKVDCSPRRFDERKANSPEEAHAMHFRLPEGLKTVGHVNIRDGHTHTRHLTNQRESDAVKGQKSAWFNDFKRDGENPERLSYTSSKSPARKAASAQIAKIPFALASHIARVYKPALLEATA